MNVYIVYNSTSFEIDGVYTDLELAKAGTGAPDDHCFTDDEWEQHGSSWILRYAPDDGIFDPLYGHQMIIVEERLIGDLPPASAAMRLPV